MNSSTVAKDSPDTYPLMPTYGQPPVQFVRGSGTELYDREGNRYLDFLCGLAVTSLGHAHPAIPSNAFVVVPVWRHGGARARGACREPAGATKSAHGGTPGIS